MYMRTSPQTTHTLNLSLRPQWRLAWTLLVIIAALTVTLLAFTAQAVIGRQWLSGKKHAGSVPAGAAASGIASAEVMPADTLLLLHFENTLNGAAGESPTQAAGLNFQPGILGAGVSLSAGNQVLYPSADNINATEGSIEFWIKPNWNGNDGQGYVVLHYGGGGGMYIAKDGANNWRLILNRFGSVDGPEAGVGFNVSHWQANQWQHAAFTWSSGNRRLRLYLNGSLEAQTGLTAPLPSVNSATFQLGAEEGNYYLNAVVDELRISAIERTQQEILEYMALTCPPPNVTSHPANRAALAGGSAFFAASADGDPTPVVQWQVSTDGGANFNHIPSATNTTLLLSSVTAAQNGNRYRAVFTNSCGSVASAAATLNVITPTAGGVDFAGLDVNNVVKAMAATSTDLYIAGEFSAVGNVSANHVARYNFATRTWSALGRGGGLTGNGLDHGHGFENFALAVADDDVYCGGNFGGVYNDVGAGISSFGLAKWNRATNTWSAVGGGLNAQVKALAVSGNYLYVGGDFTTVYNQSGGPAIAVSANRVARWDMLTNTWSALGAEGGATGNGVNGTVNAIAVSGGAVYVGGVFTTAYNHSASSVGANRVAVWNGAGWAALGGGVDEEVRAIAIDGGSVYVGGVFNTAYNGGGALAARKIARWDGAVWSALAGGVEGSVNALAVFGGAIYAGGPSEATNDGGEVISTHSIAKWDGARWSALGRDPGSSGNGVSAGLFTGGVEALAVSGDALYAGGWFNQANNSLVDHVAATRVARWDGAAWSELDNTFAGGNGTNSIVFALAAAGNDVYVGGEFTKAGNLSVNHIARWNGATSAWSPLGAGLGARGNGVATEDSNYNSGAVTAIAVRGDDVYVGGGFDRAYNGDGGSVRVRNIARWNSVTRTWSLVGQGINGEVFAIAVDGDDVYVGGGIFEVYNPDGVRTSVNHIARWNTTTNTWAALGDGSGNGVNSYAVRAIAVKGDEIYVGGDFTGVCSSGSNCISANYVARWNKVTRTWSALGGDSGPAGNGLNRGPVRDLLVIGNDVYVCGSIGQAYNSNASSVLTSGIAKWNGSNWAALGSGASGTGQGLTDGDGPTKMTLAGPNLYVTGGFHTANNSETEHVQVNLVAKWNGSAWSAVGSGLVKAETGWGSGWGIAATAGKLYISGFFSHLDGNIAGNFGRFPICQPLAVTPGALAAGTAGVAYTPVQLAASGGVAPYTFGLQAGALPAGMSLSPSGIISGTPTVSGVFSFTVAVNDAANCPGAQQFTLTIGCPTVTVNPATLPNGRVGAAYTQTISATPAIAYSFNVTGGSLPVGLTLNAATGVLSGAPAQSGTFSFTIEAAAGGCRGARSYTMTITKTATATTLAASPNPVVRGRPVVLTARVMAVLPGAAPSGVVTFKDRNAVIGTAALNAAGEATLTFTPPTPGHHRLTAIYGGTAAHLGSESEVLVLIVNNAPPGANINGR
jgi:hypothetical protein